jgi:hypothetical protein
VALIEVVDLILFEADQITLHRIETNLGCGDSNCYESEVARAPDEALGECFKRDGTLRHHVLNDPNFEPIWQSFGRP